MAKREKKYYYVLVFTSDGPVYVTSFGEHNYAYWNKEEKPYALGTLKSAEEVALGLTWNGNRAVAVSVGYELASQPYAYEEFDCTFVKKEENK